MINKPWFNRNSNLIANLYSKDSSSQDVDDLLSERVLDKLEDILTMYNQSDLLLHSEQDACGYQQLDRQFVLDWAGFTMSLPEPIANSLNIGEICFMVFASVFCAASHQNRRVVDIHDLNRIRLRLVQNSVRHVPQNSEYLTKNALSNDEVIRLVCQYTVQHIRNGTTILYANFEPKDSSDKVVPMAQDTEMRLSPIDNSVLKSFQYQPLGDDPAELAKLTDDLNQGSLFKQNVLQLVMSSVSLFTRFVLTVKLHDLIIKEHPVITASIYLPVDIENFIVWFRSHSEIHSNSEFIRQLHENIFSSLIPLGCRVDSLKNPDTRDINHGSQQLAEKEFGTDLVEQLRDGFSNIEVGEILKQPDHRFYSWIFICVFGFWFEQTLKVKWAKLFFVSESLVLFRYKEFLQQRDATGVPNEHNYARGLKLVHTPLCVYMDQRWLCYYDYKWYACESVESMLLTWCLLIQRHCDSQTSDQIDLKPFFERIGLITPVEL